MQDKEHDEMSEEEYFRIIEEQAEKVAPKRTLFDPIQTPFPEGYLFSKYLNEARKKLLDIERFNSMGELIKQYYIASGKFFLHAGYKDFGNFDQASEEFLRTPALGLWIAFTSIQRIVLLLEYPESEEASWALSPQAIEKYNNPEYKPSSYSNSLNSDPYSLASRMEIIALEIQKIEMTLNMFRYPDFIFESDLDMLIKLGYERKSELDKRADAAEEVEKKWKPLVQQMVELIDSGKSIRNAAQIVADRNKDKEIKWKTLRREYYDRKKETNP